MDPELGINVVDLGLIYDLGWDDENDALVIHMTLTSAGLPAHRRARGADRAGARRRRRAVPHQLGVDAAVGPRADHRRRPRHDAGARLRDLTRVARSDTRSRGIRSPSIGSMSERHPPAGTAPRPAATAVQHEVAEVPARGAAALRRRDRLSRSRRPITDVLARAVQLGDTGYTPPEPGVREAFVEFARRRFGWEVDPALVFWTGDVMMGVVEILRRVIAPGERVVVMTPVYPPFFDTRRGGGRGRRAGAARADGDRLGDRSSRHRGRARRRCARRAAVQPAQPHRHRPHA